MDLSPASSYVGLTGDDYEQVIAATELAAGMTGRAREMGAMSGCALVYRALAAAAFGAPFGLYPTGEAFALIYALAGGSPWAPAGALRIPTFTAPPLLADALIWGENGPRPAHVDACVEEAEDSDPYSASSPPTLGLTVIAGWQRDREGKETVGRLERRLRWQGTPGRWVDEGTGRVLLACVGADEMAERYASPL